MKKVALLDTVFLAGSRRLCVGCVQIAKIAKKCEKMRKIAGKACKIAATYGMIGKLWGGKLWEGVL